MKSVTLDPQARYILLHEGQVFCPQPVPWQLLAAHQVERTGLQVEQALPLIPGDTSIQVLCLRGERAEPEAWLGLRQLLTQVGEADFRLLGTAFQVAEWASNHRFCGRCGGPTQMSERERALHCPVCNLSHYPRISPCVIALVTRGHEVLLARSRRYKMPLYSCLAGFIEAGENAEEAVHREVLEEAGVQLGSLRYVASQSWPFPHQLMLAYLAEYESGDIRLDEEELLDAQWWWLDALPPIPPPQTIAGQLIARYIEERKSSS